MLQPVFNPNENYFNRATFFFNRPNGENIIFDADRERLNNKTEQMKLFQEKNLLRLFEIAFWIGVGGMYYFYAAVTYSVKGANLLTLSAMGTFAIIIYVNTHLLIPKFLSKGKTLWYYLLFTFFFIAVTIVRDQSYSAIIFELLEKKLPTWSVNMLYHAIINVMCVFASFLFRSSIDHVALHQQQEQLKSRHLQAELNLLKARVQPHFLFNALHNIYATAYRESPQTANQIDKLSGIMRYFIDEAHKEQVTISTEINFISNYIQLELVRMRYPMQVNEKYPETDAIIPPMLLVPFIENVFKHGVDKTRSDNFIDITIEINQDKLYYQVKNRIVPTENCDGMGLENLRSRLKILFGDQFMLSARAEGDVFIANLTFPVCR